MSAHKLGIKEKLSILFYQKVKHYMARYERKEIKQRLRNKRVENFHFKRPGDKKLTKEQVAEIKEFWSKYKFAYRVYPNMVRTSYNRSGIFDPRYIPFEIKKDFVLPVVANSRYTFIEGKAFLGKHIIHGKLPDTVLSAWNGIYYDEHYNVITKEQAIDRLAAEEGEVVVKPILITSGGQGITFCKNPSLEEAKDIIKKMKGNVMIQRAVKQHPLLNRFNQSTVNTIRVTSYRRKNNEVVILAALLKVGGGKVRVDNYKQGGCLVGMDLDGKLFNWALASDYSRIHVLPSGVDLEKEAIEIPNFDKLKEMVKNVHLSMPQLRVISWDIAINEDAEPVVIEINFGGDWRLHQILTGPVFREYTEEILDEVFLENYYKKDSTMSYDIHEYYDHVEIVKYCGWKKHVVVPGEMKGKPVTKIKKQAFGGNARMESVTLPDSVNRIETEAFRNCKSLVEYNHNAVLKFCGKDMLKGCNKLTTVNVPDSVKNKYSSFERFRS